jgi:hypothetical protein
MQMISVGAGDANFRRDKNAATLDQGRESPDARRRDQRPCSAKILSRDHQRHPDAAVGDRQGVESTIVQRDIRVVAKSRRR